MSFGDILKRRRLWRDNLQPGDEVAVCYAGYRNRFRLLKVERTTKLHIVVDNTKYRRKDGFAVGSTGYYRDHILEPTPEVMEQIRRDRMLSKIETTKWTTLSTERLAAVLAALNGGGENE